MIADIACTAPWYGMDVANVCDITVARENARFGSSQVKYAMNGFYRGMVRKTGPQCAWRMLFAGDTITAQEPHRADLVDKLTPVG